MVCSLGNGRMAAMARLLEGGNISKNIPEEIGNQKLAVQYIYRELRGANEANLLDEEDMHVFGFKPMADPLKLVCCNACKKPVKASQYAAHAVLCRSLKTTEETILELDGNTRHRKPPRKERKKSLAAYSNQPAQVGEQEISEVIDAGNTMASESHMDRQIRMTSSLTMDAKRNFSCVDTAYMMDGSAATAHNTDDSNSVVPPSTKRFKLMAGCLPLPNGPNAATSATKILDTNALYASRNSPVATVSGSETPKDRQAHECCLLTKDLPAPLCSKIYYSHRSSRLRIALSHQYFVASSAKEPCSGRASQHESQQSMILSQASCQEVCPLEQVDNLIKKESPLRKPDQVLAQCSELFLSKSGVRPSSNDFSNQHPMDNIPRPMAASVGLARSRYISQSYSFAGNSGELLGPVEPPNGSVPVV